MPFPGGWELVVPISSGIVYFLNRKWIMFGAQLSGAGGTDRGGGGFLRLRRASLKGGGDEGVRGKECL